MFSRLKITLATYNLFRPWHHVASSQSTPSSISRIRLGVRQFGLTCSSFALVNSRFTRRYVLRVCSSPQCTGVLLLRMNSDHLLGHSGSTRREYGTGWALRSFSSPKKHLQHPVAHAYLSGEAPSAGVSPRSASSFSCEYGQQSLVRCQYRCREKGAGPSNFSFLSRSMACIFS